MSLVAPVVLYAFALYAALGICIGIGFVVAGITRVLDGPASVTIPARLLILPGAIALWPIVLRRWLQAGRAGAHP
jgi:hypothetical protein